MAELTPREHLQPWLLDRLQDDKPAEEEEPREARIWSVHKLKHSVVRDLAWLLNTGCLATTQDLRDYPQVQHAVLNYGIQDLTGTTITTAAQKPAPGINRLSRGKPNCLRIRRRCELPTARASNSTSISTPAAKPI